MTTKRHIAIIFVLLMSLTVSNCGPGQLSIPTVTPTPIPSPTQVVPLYKDPGQLVEARVEDLLSRMNLDEKIGQMTQADNKSISPELLSTYYIGAVLSGGQGISSTNTLAEWTNLAKSYQDEALKTPLAIPVIFGVDSIHGFTHVNGATVFPQNIGLGAARDPELVEKIGQATAEEMLAAGIPWNFGPTVAVPQDIRWGRTYEGFSEDTQLVLELSSAYITGFQTVPDSSRSVLDQSLHAGATAKHYLGDGGTMFGTSHQNTYKPYLLDQGDMRYDEATVRSLFLPPYAAAVDDDVTSVMVSYSSWNGTKMHTNKHWITDVLKGELGFKGFVVSDWGGIEQIDSDYTKAVVTAVNAGIDMAMVQNNYVSFIKVMKQAVAAGDISQERVDDAVRRILRAKFKLGLFEHPYGDPSLAPTVGSDLHRQLARQAVRESLVLLKNDKAALPIAKNIPTIFVAGRGADSVGMQSGGWTIDWQGHEQLVLTGSTSILEAIKSTVSPTTIVEYNKFGKFNGAADIGIVVVGELPYAEGFGDKQDLSLASSDVDAITSTRAHVNKLIVVLLSGRPMVITNQFQGADAWVAAWLPGSEGAGVSDVLFGDYPFVGKLPYSWPRSNAQLPINENNAAGLTGCQAPLFPFGYGLGEAGSQPIEWLNCP